jgi:general secretion pathway protein L
MKLRVFLPAVERPDTATRFAWILFDARRGVLREDVTAAADIPRAGDCEAVLPAARVLFARLKLPRVNAATIRELLPYAVEDRLLADPANIHSVAGTRNAQGETTVAVVDREWLSAMLAALRAAGVRPQRAFCESALLAGGRGDWNVVWGPERGLLVDDEGVGTAFDRGGAAGVPLAIRIALDEAASRADRPEHVRVHTEQGEPLPEIARWSSEANVAFSAGTTWEILRAGPLPSDALELLQGEFAPRSGRLSPARIPRAAVALAAIIAALQLGFTAADVWRLERERSALEARREAAFRSAFPDARTVIDPELQMARNLADLRRARGLAADDDFLAQLTSAARGKVPVKSVEYAGGNLQVKR